MRSWHTREEKLGRKRLGALRKEVKHRDEWQEQRTGKDGCSGSQGLRKSLDDNRERNAVKDPRIRYPIREEDEERRAEHPIGSLVSKNGDSGQRKTAGRQKITEEEQKGEGLEATRGLGTAHWLISSSATGSPQ